MKIKSLKYNLQLCIALLILLVASACKKFIEVADPIDSIPTTAVFESDTKVTSAVRVLYGQMVGSTSSFNTTFGFGGGVQLSMNVSSDELIPSDPNNEFYLHQITSANSTNENSIWSPLYTIIFSANAVINNVPGSPAVTEANKKQFIAEAKFIRAANYLYLVNLYGGVPLVVSTDYRVNAVLPRSTVDEVYNLILEDLIYAEANLSSAYIGTSAAVSSPQRLRANKYAAAALLARVYLYRRDYTNAALMASKVIDGAGKAMYDFEPDLNRTFLTSSKEVILQLQQPGTNLYTWEAWNQVPGNATIIPAYRLSPSLLRAFEPNDRRIVNWVGTNINAGTTYYYPFKYKLRAGTGTVRTESMVFLRLSEVYLIRAEARAMENQLALAISDMDAIRARSIVPASYVPTNPTTDKTRLLELIAHERFVELFAEVGHRWMDLIRTGAADLVLKDRPNWRNDAKLFPIPNGDIEKNRALTQNPGYN
jgi:hypothetical protein